MDERFKALAAPFPPSDVLWRITRKNQEKTKAQVAAYVDARGVMDRLDDVIGPAGWQDSYTPGAAGGVLCTISILVDGQWIAKQDGAENTDIEPVKGGLSDSFKRAAFKWGVGRYLYYLPSPWVSINQYGDFDPPKLPEWAIPKEQSRGQAGNSAPTSAPVAGSNPAPATNPELADAMERAERVAEMGRATAQNAQLEPASDVDGRQLLTKREVSEVCSSLGMGFGVVGAFILGKDFPIGITDEQFATWAATEGNNYTAKSLVELALLHLRNNGSTDVVKTNATNGLEKLRKQAVTA